MGRALTTMAVVAGILGGAVATHAAEKPIYKRLVDASWESEAVRGALRGARRRLARSVSAGAQRLLRRLGPDAPREPRHTGSDPEGYLDMLVFYDAAGSGRCSNPNILAMTSPGNRAIFVCAAQFAKKGLTDRRQTEMILIHETLHTLGLGENPPSSNAITAQVMSRCR